MHLSLWTLESRELIEEWSTNNFEKVPIEVVSSWQNMHLLSSERCQKIKWIKGKQLKVFCTECLSRLYFVLLAPFTNGVDSLGETVLEFAVQLVDMMSDINDCVTVSDYRRSIANCSWSITSLLTIASRPCALLPWALLSGIPENVLTHLSPLMKTCLRDSLPTSMACLVSRERQIASSPSWDLLPSLEQLSLTLFCRCHAPISDSIVRLVSQPGKPLYRLIQIELVPEVALLMLCGSQTSLDLLKQQVTKYWGPLISELRSFEPQIIQYAPLQSVPDSLCSFFQLRCDEGQCISGYMHTDSVPASSMDEVMKRLYLESRSSLLSTGGGVSCAVIRDRGRNATFVVSHGAEDRRTLVLAFVGKIDGLDARVLATEVEGTIDRWMLCNNEQEAD